MSGSTSVFDTAEGDLDEIAGRIREVSAIMPQLVMEIIRIVNDVFVNLIWPTLII